MNESLLAADRTDQVALVSDDASLTYTQLRACIAQQRPHLSGLVFLRAELTVASIALYVACIDLGAPVLLLDRDIERDALDALIGRYRPRLAIGFDGDPADGMRSVTLPNWEGRAWAGEGSGARTHPDLALLLSTSGSTGNPKLVKLSRTAVFRNADAIVAGLGIGVEDRAITPLPYSYTYGLSIINSHLRAGATVVVSDEAVVARGFWDTVDRHQVTSLAGVPTTYKMLRQMRWNVASHPTVRSATQAGGRLGDEDREHFRDMFSEAGGTFFVMYGQTEATARITITAPNDLFEAVSTAGRAVAGGELEIRHADEHGIGEVWFRGPNVMMGYAEHAEDLAAPDAAGGVLETGDLGYLDGERLFLTGRSKRIVKIFGKRVSLDDVDRWVQERADGVAVQGNDAVVLFIVGGYDPELRQQLATHLHVHPTGVRVTELDAIPLLSSGKIDYQELNRRAQS